MFCLCIEGITAFSEMKPLERTIMEYFLNYIKKYRRYIILNSIIVLVLKEVKCIARHYSFCFSKSYWNLGACTQFSTGFIKTFPLTTLNHQKI